MTTLLPPRTRTADPDAVNRLDDGPGLLGDVLLADVFDAQCRQRSEDWQERMWRAQDAAALDAHRTVCDGCDHCEVAA